MAGVNDPAKADLTKMALRGYTKVNPSLDHRLPITLPILERIISAFNFTISSNYQAKLVKAMCAKAFFAALRIGELTTVPGKPNKNLILLNQLSLLRNKTNETEAIKLHMANFKNSKESQPIDIFIYRDSPVCPVSLVLDYLQVRGSGQGPLFCWPDCSAITRSYFTQCLNDAFDFCNLDRSKYKSHSFRIGAASWAAAKGLSDAQIRDFGRWKSNAFLRYIRTPSIGLI